jgi:hypothetical protein
MTGRGRGLLHALCILGSNPVDADFTLRGTGPGFFAERRDVEKASSSDMDSTPDGKHYPCDGSPLYGVACFNALARAYAVEKLKSQTVVQ